MAFDPQDYDVKPIGAAGLTERTSLDGSERILVQAGADADVDTTPMQFFRWQVVKSILDGVRTVSGGGTGRNSFASGEVLVGNGDGEVNTVSRNGIDTRESFPPSLHNHDDRYYTESEILNKTYPIGSIYLSVVATNPGTLFGGTWEQLQNRFLIGAGDSYTVNATGGEVNHTLTIDEMPSHLGHHEMTVAGGSAGYYLDVSKMSTSGSGGRGWSIVAGNEMHPYTYNIGGGASHNNMPPYLAVYMWKRTA